MVGEGVEIEEAAEVFGVGILKPLVTIGCGLEGFWAVIAFQLLLFAAEITETLPSCTCRIFVNSVFLFQVFGVLSNFSSVVFSYGRGLRCAYCRSRVFRSVFISNLAISLFLSGSL